MTKRQLTRKIEDLEQWLRDNSSEHEARPTIEADLRNYRIKLANRDYV